MNREILVLRLFVYPYIDIKTINRDWHNYQPLGVKSQKIREFGLASVSAACSKYKFPICFLFFSYFCRLPRHILKYNENAMFTFISLDYC